MIEKWGHLSKQWHGDPGSTKLLTLPGWKKKGTRSWSTQWKLEPWQRWIYHEAKASGPLTSIAPSMALGGTQAMCQVEGIYQLKSV